MKTSKVFYGDIYILEQFGSAYSLQNTFEEYGVSTEQEDVKEKLNKKRALLIEFKKGRYVDIDQIDHFFDLIRLQRIDEKQHPSLLGSIILTSICPNIVIPKYKFVKEETLYPVFEPEKKYTSVRQLKKLRSNESRSYIPHKAIGQ